MLPLIDRLAALIVDESKWLPMAMLLALLAVAVRLYGDRRPDVPSRHRVMAAMNLFFGLTIGTMAGGHLLAVTTKLAYGTLTGSLLFLYAIGALLAVPSWFLVRHALRMFRVSGVGGRATPWLNAWLSLTLLVLGPHNLPLAVPGVFNIGYHVHSRRAVGWAIVSLTVIGHATLFIGSLIFLASGQSFEQFSGMQ